MTVAPVLPPKLHGAARAMFHYMFPRLAYRRLRSEEWREEEIEMALLSALVDPRREAVDVGANVGHYALRLSRLVSRVHAFEPHPRLSYVLSRSMPANVVVRNEAVSDQMGTAVLIVPFFERPVEGMASIASENRVYSAARGLTRIRISSTTLDSLADNNVGFVKIDVEGHETSVLSGATELIRRQQPTFLVEVEERHKSGSLAAAFGFFAAQGYRGFFACRDAIQTVEEFTMDLQSESLIINAAPRRSYHYVNNFMFVPGADGDACHRQLSALLRTARAIS